jgi:hypothetical protein
MTLLDNDVFTRDEDFNQINNNDNIVGGGEDLMNNYKMSKVSRYENLISEQIDNQTDLSPDMHKILVNKMNGSQILSPTAIAKMIE